jgi:hypothetical protein
MVYLLRFHQPVGSGKKYVSYYLGFVRHVTHL